jgi:hypothetical protein
VVEGVDGIYPELELITFCPEIERFAGGEVKDDLTGSVDVVPVVGAKRS